MVLLIVNYFTGKLLQAREKCFQNLHYIERHEEHTIAHAIHISYNKTKVQSDFLFYLSVLYQIFL